jgi:alpha-tubulin suppressor-like RCC1 family protein
LIAPLPARDFRATLDPMLSSVLTVQASVALSLIVCVAAACGDSGPEPGDGGSDTGGPHPPDAAADGAAPCASDSDCDDGSFCNGVEECQLGADGADARGCAPAGMLACPSDETCDEATRRCISDCELMGDMDGDGRLTLACGGDDCDDADPAVHPGATEICDASRDEDCNPESLGSDADGDAEVSVDCCNGSVCGSDCDDASAEIHSGAVELCNGRDDTCDGVPAAGEDVDGDGFAATDSTCSGGPLPRSDCNDADAAARPGATEICNSVDDDCDGTVDGASADAVCGSAPHTRFSCTSGRCTAECDVGWGNCDGFLFNGCEADLASDRLNCGACAQECYLDCDASACEEISTIEPGFYNTCAVTTRGRAVCWGENSAYEVGDGTSVDRLVPTVVTLVPTATSVTNGFAFTCAVLATGRVRCWGLNRFGELGDGILDHGLMCARPDAGGPGGDCSNVGVEVFGITDAIAVDAYESTACALLATGTVKCWGSDENGRLGDGLATHAAPCDFGPDCSALPVTVVGITDAVAISVGARTSCALLRSGQVYCWGSNETGTVGDGTFANRHAPVPVVGLTDAVDVSVGLAVSCAARRDGTVACWGSDNLMELGDGSATLHPRNAFGVRCSPSPVMVSGIVDAVEVSTTIASACALHASGRVSCWGSSWLLGDGIERRGIPCGSGDTADCSPVPVSTGLVDVVALGSSGWEHTCAVRRTGRAVCWGAGYRGQRGDGTTAYVLTPTFVAPLAP